MKRPVKRAPPPPAAPRVPKPRGRPRNAEARAAMLRAARELLDEGGPGAVTMEAVAERAGVGKPTVYRSFSDRHAVTMAALMDGDPDLAPHRGADALGALRRQLRAIAARFATNTGRHVTMLLASADADSELSKSFRHHFVLARRSEGRVLLERARDENQIRPDVNVEVALDLLYGPLFFRLLMGHAPLDERFMEQMMKEAFLGLAPRSRD